MFQGLTLLALCVYAKAYKFLFRIQHLAGIILFVLVAGSYFYVYSKRVDPSVMIVNLFIDSVQKSAVGGDSKGRLYHVFTYPYMLLKLFTPWVLLLLLLSKKQHFSIFNNPLVKFSFLFIVFNIGLYWITGKARLRYVYMFVPFAMNIFVHLYDQFNQRNPGLINKYIKRLGVLFFLLFGGLFLTPFFFKINGWFFALLCISFFLFLIACFRFSYEKIWLVVFGVLLVRLSYSIVGIPVQNEGLMDYKPPMAAISEKAKGQPVFFYLPADTLKLDIVTIDTLYKWKKGKVLVPSSLFHQIPYYYYRSSRQILQYDTLITPGRIYISYDSLVRNENVERLFATSISKKNDTLVLFRKR